MKGRLLGALAAVGIVAWLAGAVSGQPASAPASAPASPPVDPSVLDTMVGQIVDLFPAGEGEVLEVRGGTVTLSAGRKDGLREGLPLALVREGREIKHPRTGQVLGRVEDSVGRARVTTVQDAFAFAEVAEGATVQPGDRFRLSTDKVGLVVLTLNEGLRDSLAEAASRDLLERLAVSGRFKVLLGDAMRPVLEQQGVPPDRVLAGQGVPDVARRFKVDNVLVVYFKRLGGRPFMDARFFTLPRAEAVISASFQVPSSIRSASSGARFSAGGPLNPPQARPRSLLARLLGGDLETGSYSSAESSMPLREVATLPYVVHAVDVSMAPKDRVPRLAVTDSWRVYVYKIVDRQLELDWSESVRALGRVINLQLADLDGDGVLEVVGTRFDARAGLNAFVIGLRDGTPRVLADDVPEFLFAVDTQGQGVKQTLWAQRFNPESFFTPGQADLMALKDGKLVTERAVSVPSRFRPMGATYSNIAGKDSRVLVMIDENNRLQIVRDAEDLWRSTTTVGGGATVAEHKVFESRSERSRFYKIEPTPLAVDLDGDDIEEIVVPQNLVREGLLAVVFRSPAGYRIQTVDSGFQGLVAGLGAFRNPDDIQPTLILALVRYSTFMKVSGDTQIIMTIPQE